MRDSLLNPKNWFLDEKEKKKLYARRRYYGESLERALADIDAEYLNDPKAKALAHLELDHKYNRIDEYTLCQKKIELLETEGTTEYRMHLLELDKKFSKVSDSDYDKHRATIHNEPWVSVKRIVMDPSKPSEGEFELDWNDKFVQTLQEAGFQGVRPELVVQDWFDSLCKNIAKEYGATFPEEIKEFEFRNPRRVKSEDGKTEVM